MLNGGQSSQTTDNLAVVGILLKVLVVISELGAAGDGKPRCRVPFVFRERLIAVGVKILVEVRHRDIDAGYRIGFDLVAIRIGPLVPEARTEDTKLRDLAYRRRLTILAIAVELIDGAGGGNRRQIFLEILCVVVAVGIGFYFDV